MKTLFVLEKYCDGNPKGGPTNNFHNLLNTYAKNVDKHFDIVYIDESFLNGIHVDSLLPELVKEKKYNNIIFSFLGDSHMNPSIDICHKLANNSRLFFMWPDTGYEWAQTKIRQLKDYTHISWAGEEVDLGVRNHKFLFTPEDDTLYFPDTKEYELSFVGSINGYRERYYYLHNLLNNNIKVKVCGGQREGKLTPEQYAYVIRKSKINLNFPESPSGIDQFKGRCLETIASKSLLLSRKSSVTSKYLKNEFDFLEFENLEDLYSKIKYLSENPKQLEYISENGFNTYKTKYSSKIFWEETLKNV